MKLESIIHALRLCFTASLFWISTPSFAQDLLVPTPTPPPSNFVANLWPETFFQSAMGRSPELQYRFTNEIFEGDHEADLFQDNFSGDPGFSFKIKRTLYNNFDLLNTYTVVDRFSMRMERQIYGIGDAAHHYDIPVGDVLIPFAGLSLGANGALELRDIRQAARLDAINRSSPRPADGSSQEADADIRELNPYLNANPLNSPVSIWLNNLLRPLILPFKIPFSRRDLHNLTDGEMISYDLTGQVGFGGSIGWQVVPNDIIRAGVTLSMETHLSGEFQVSIMREDDRYAKVRISKIRGRGRSGAITAGVDFEHLFKGFFLFKDSSIAMNVGSFSPKIIPFQFRLMSDSDHEIDIAYRYDLNSEEGKEAFHRAVLGSFVRSEEVAQEEAGSSSPTVSKLFTRTSVHQSRGRSAGIDLNVILKFVRARHTQEMTSEINLPDGTVHVFRSVEETSDISHGFFRNSEKTSHQMSVIVNKEGFISGHDGSVTLISENMVDDSRTQASELNQYAADIENLLHEPLIFPRFPESIPSQRNPNRNKHPVYGRSSFYYGYTIKEEGVKNFLHSNWDEIQAKADAAGISVNKDAFLKSRAAFDAKDPDKTYASLTEFFADRRHIPFLADLVVSMLNASNYDKFLMAQNQAFGSVQTRGSHLAPIADSIQRSEELPSTGAITSTSDSVSSASPAILTDLKTTVGPDHQRKVSFHLSRAPQFLYFRITPISRSHAHQKAVELVVLNRDQRFKAGDNTITLDANSSDDLEHRLSSKFETGDIVALSVGLSEQRTELTYGSSVQFQITP